MNTLARLVALLAAFLCVPGRLPAAEQLSVTYAGKTGPGLGKHIVFVSGDEEYRSEEACPMLAKILAERHGFTCTVLFAVDPKTGHVDPWEQTNIPDLHLLRDADVAVVFLRFRELPDEQMKRFVEFVNSGKGIIGIRPSIAAFLYQRNRHSPFANWSYDHLASQGGFGKAVFGETWWKHHGAHNRESTRGVIVEEFKDHPVLRGVADVWGPTDVYGVRPLPSDAQVLMRGQVVAGMTPADPAVTGEKNDPMMPLAWTRAFRGASNKTSRVFYTSMGASVDFENEGLRRMFVNACYWAAGIEDRIPAKADVEYIDEYRPSFFSLAPRPRPLDIRPADFRIGAFPSTPPQPVKPTARLDLRPHDRIAFVGNSLAERMNYHGHFESLLHSRFPDLELVVRNFGWPGDEVAIQPRPENYTTIDDPFVVFGANVLFCFYGWNESFAGAQGVPKFKQELANFVLRTRKRLANESARFVFVSPVAFENAHDPLRPDGVRHNANLRLYTEAMREMAGQLGVPFVDLFTPTLREFAAEPKLEFTVNGIHLNNRGDRLVAELLDRALFDGPNPARLDSAPFERLREAVNDKSFVHWNDYRMVNGWYVYGGRRAPYDTRTFPEEYRKLRRMAAVRDRHVWDLAQGKLASAAPDDSGTGDLAAPKTAFGTKQYSEPKELRYLAPEEALRAFTVAPGYAINCFASEAQFAELGNPVQVNFDNRGRLWVLTMPSYPQWQPGNPKPDDKLLIFEDTNHDGVADRMKVFAGGLHVPIGFEFGNGGVYVAQPPYLLFLKDTDGDDRADTREIVLDGFGSEDTHVGICALEWSHGGELILLEGVAKSTTVETVHGPLRNRTPTVYGFDPRTQRLRVLIKPAVVNPWACVFDRWGQGFYGDGTTAAQHWMTPLSGAAFSGRKGMDEFTKYSGTRLRPIAGSEFVSSRQFPESAQGNYLFACVINLNGIPQFRVRDDGSGFVGERVEDLVVSSDRNFRPVDPQFGPDGALYFADWHTPLIGHMQYSQRDPNRDHGHGRVYRIVAKDRPLLEPAIAAGAPLAELIEQLKAPEDRTRYRARRELRDREAKEVLAALAKWMRSLDGKDEQHEHHLCEALWVQQGFHAVELPLLKRLLAAKDFRARAAAVHVLSDERAWMFEGSAVTNDVLALLRPGVTDEHPRVRLEAVRALSFITTIEAVELALEAARLPLDYSLRYTLESTLGALEPVWKPALQRNEIARRNAVGLEFLRDLDLSRKPGGLAQKYFNQLLRLGDLTPDARAKAIAAVADTRGKADAGKAVFARLCVACHKAGELGAELGPGLSDAGKRLSRHELVESVMDPNATVDAKYFAVNITTRDGEEFSGLLVGEDAGSMTLRIGAEITKEIDKREIKARDTSSVSSMPDGLAATLSAQEFVDLIEFLAAQK